MADLRTLIAQCRRCGVIGRHRRPTCCVRCETAQHAEWRRNNRSEAKRRWDRARKQRVAWIKSGDVTKQQLVDLVHTSGGKCYYCHSKVAFVRTTPSCPRGFDHVVPRAKGGMHTIENLVMCCADCNRKKNVHAKESVA